MTNITIDLSNYRDRVGNRVAPGRYRVVVEDAWEERSNAGNVMVTMNLRINDGGEFDGSSLIDRLVLSEKSLFRVVGFMQAIGMPTPKKKLQVNLQRFIGQQLEVDVEDGEPYNGRVKSEVRAYHKTAKAEASAQSFDLEDLEDSTASSLADRVEQSREIADDGAVNLDTIEI